MLIIYPQELYQRVLTEAIPKHYRLGIASEIAAL